MARRLNGRRRARRAIPASRAWWAPAVCWPQSLGATAGGWLAIALSARGRGLDPVDALLTVAVRMLRLGWGGG